MRPSPFLDATIHDSIHPHGALQVHLVNIRCLAAARMRIRPTVIPRLPRPCLCIAILFAMSGQFTMPGLFTTSGNVFGDQVGGQTSESATAYESLSDIVYRVSDDALVNKMCRLDLVFPRGEKDFTTIVWFHGGGLTGGSRKIPDGLADQGIAVASVDYRLSPDVTVQQCIQDAASAIAWVHRNISKYGGSAEKIVVSGHSAGGYLTSMVGLDPSYLAAHSLKPTDLAGLVPLSGHTITHFTERKSRGIDGKQPIIDSMAPLFHVTVDELPPILMVTGDRELEMLGRYEENAYFQRMLLVAGHDDVVLHELDGYNHGGMVAPALGLLVKFAKRVTQNGVSH
ncbi:MAG: alpha/beta hydrolase [Planctomycetota bacterium]